MALKETGSGITAYLDKIVKANFGFKHLEFVTEPGEHKILMHGTWEFPPLQLTGTVNQSLEMFGEFLHQFRQQIETPEVDRLTTENKKLKKEIEDLKRYKIAHELR